MFAKLKENIKKLVKEGNPCHDKADGKFCGTGRGNPAKQKFKFGDIVKLKDGGSYVISGLSKEGHIRLTHTKTGKERVISKSDFYKQNPNRIYKVKGA